MSQKWNREERERNRKVLLELYVKRNLAIGEIGVRLGISEKTVYKRLMMLGIKPIPSKKLKYRNQRSDIHIPDKRSEELAEFLGIMLGDGRLSPSQVIVTLGTKEENYVVYVKNKIQSIFSAQPKIAVRATGYPDIYLGSVRLSRWLSKQGLVYNKVKAQVDMPKWILSKRSYSEGFLRGFFDTDGSVYRLKYGVQISLTNKSLPLLHSLQKLLFKLKYKPSRISSDKIYLTKREDIYRFFQEIKPVNKKHTDRFKSFVALRCVGTQVVNEE